MKKENANIKGRAYYQSLKARYLNAAKEASSSGDWILKEYNLQCAEHYSRVLLEKFSQQPQSMKPAPVQTSPVDEQPESPVENPESEIVENKEKPAKSKSTKKTKKTETIS